MLARAGCGDDKKAEAPEPPPAPVVVAPVTRAQLKSSTEYVGRVVAVDTVDLRARVEGFLIERAFREGEDVAAGALLFTIERAPYQTAVDTAAARVVEAKAEVPRTRKDYERARTLFGNGNVSQKTLDQALADQQAAVATLNAREAELRKAELDLGYTRIYAPFTGRIGRSTYSVGNLVGPASDVLATLVKLDPIYVVFNVSERAYLDYVRACRAGGQGRQGGTAAGAAAQAGQRLRVPLSRPFRFRRQSGRSDHRHHRRPRQFRESGQAAGSGAVRQRRRRVREARTGPGRAAGGGAGGPGRPLSSSSSTKMTRSRSAASRPATASASTGR